jgi:hypothetical protein
MLLAPWIATAALAGDATADWEAVIALDAGPAGEARTMEAARAAAWFYGGLTEAGRGRKSG